MLDDDSKVLRFKPPQLDCVFLQETFANVWIHQQARDELEALIQEKDKPFFNANYEKRIEYLSNHMNRELTHCEWFEILKKTEGKRAVRFARICGNLRIIYVIKEDNAYLLAPFLEKSGKGNTSYKAYLPTADKRMLDIDQK